MELIEIKEIMRKASIEVDIQGHGKHTALFETDFERVAIELVKKLTLTDVSSMFSAEQMEQAFNDGVEAEQQRCGEFNIENYC